MSDMKLILESWRGYVEEQAINELEGSDPVTYAQFGALLRLITGAKQGLKGEALANFSKIGKFFVSGDAANLIKVIGGITGLAEQQEVEKQILFEEPITLAIAVTALGQLATAVGATKGIADLSKKLYKKFRGQPTAATDKAPFLDLFNVDPKYSAILDDRLEEEFFDFWLSGIEQEQDQNKNMDVNDLDVNLQLQKFVRDKYERGISGHTAPGISSAGTQAGLKQTTKQVKKAARKKAAVAAAAAE